MMYFGSCLFAMGYASLFREKGHEAYSCDILECSGGFPEWHIMQDVIPLLNGNCEFKTLDGEIHKIEGRWDMIIAHPPCTRLCNSGQRWLYYGEEEYRKKKTEERDAAIKFFLAFTEADCDRIAIENPTGIMSNLYRNPDCKYNPYDFEGETDCKKTCLWLKGLPPLEPTRKTPLPKEERTQGALNPYFKGRRVAWNDPIIARLRSVTPEGVAKAMAEQWG